MSYILILFSVLGCSSSEGFPKNRSEFKQSLIANFGNMKKTKFSESQIIGILKEQEQGEKLSTSVASAASVSLRYQWKSKFSGLDVQHLKRMKDLEAELSQYKKIVAEQT